ncbi:MAG: type II secretion system F family protein [Candidatus Micrarchaeia archaeon]|jgi:flagellar protein FlaJ
MKASRIIIRSSYALPRRWVEAIGKLLAKGGFDTTKNRYLIGLCMLGAASLGILVFLIFAVVTADYRFAAFSGLLVVMAEVGGAYVILKSTAYQRSRKIESVLPDALRIISANMRAGMTVENALWSAARPEFGPFRDELSRVAADTFGGMPIEDALLAMPDRVDSRLLEHSVNLMVGGLRLGGRMTDLLDRIAADISSRQGLQRQIETSTTTYSIFIVFSALVAAPMLFAVSTFYSEINETTLTGFTSGMQIDSAARARISSSGIPILLPSQQDTQTDQIAFADIRLFSLGVIIIIAFFAALLIAQIKEGESHRGLSYVPIFVAVAMAVFITSLFGLETVFAGMV